MLVDYMLDMDIP